MRVIAGIYKSRVLKSLSGAKLRPTSDRLRETLFNILGSAVEDSLFVDLFAGSGAVGIEALSRGARFAYFIESHRPAAALIRKNLAALQIAAGAEVLETEVASGLGLLASRKLRGRDGKLTQANFIFLDPPYAASEEYAPALETISRLALLDPGGAVIAEHFKKLVLPDQAGHLARTRTVSQGDSALSFYRAG